MCYQIRSRAGVKWLKTTFFQSCCYRLLFTICHMALRYHYNMISIMMFWDICVLAVSMPDPYYAYFPTLNLSFNLH